MRSDAMIRDGYAEAKTAPPGSATFAGHTLDEIDGLIRHTHDLVDRLAPANGRKARR